MKTYNNAHYAFTGRRFFEDHSYLQTDEAEKIINEYKEYGTIIGP